MKRFYQNNQFDPDFDEEINLREQIEKYIIQWKWFVLGIVIALSMAYIYLRYTPPKYEVATKILIKGDEKGGLSSELAAFEDLGMFSGVKNNVDNEIELLRSRSLLANVVKSLDLNVQYFEQGRVRVGELYGDLPLKMNVIASDSLFHEVDTTFTVTIKSSTSFELKDEKEKIIGTNAFGKSILMGFGSIILTPNFNYKKNIIGKEIIITISPVEKVTDNYNSRIRIGPVNKKSSVIKLSLKDVVKQKAVDILNNLVKQYNQEAIVDKSEIGKNTAKFINERLGVITEGLSEVDETVESFKTANNLTDITSETGLFLENVSANEKKIFEINTQLQLVAFMEEYLKKQEDEYVLIPANLGFTDEAINEVTAKFNELVLERNRILKNSSKKNPIIVNLDAQLFSVKQSLKESLSNLKASLQITLTGLNKQEERINSQISSIPKKEREYRVIKRKQDIKEALYLYLLQKREENAISLAVTVANAKVVDVAYGSNTPVAPKRNIVYAAALLVGLLIPFLFFYAKDLLDTKIHGRKDLEEKLNIPILGDIPQSESKKKLVVGQGMRSSAAEAFRLLRTNIDFMLSTNNQTSKTIFVTSTISGEGKSFIALNLASTLAISGKKVLLVGMDLRAPKISEYVGIKQGKGLTNFIIEKELPVEEIVQSAPEIESLDMILSGIVPPNPAELLMNGRVKDLIEAVKNNYEYIIVDTAPVSLVTDTLLISSYADSFVYVTRANYLDKRLLSIPETLYKEKRLPQMAMLINDSDHKKGYGYGYGYGNKLNSIPWWKRH